MMQGDPDKIGECSRAMMQVAIDCLGKAYVCGAYPNADAFFDDLAFVALVKCAPENGRYTAFGTTMNELRKRLKAKQSADAG
jgi:hypothetical protein